MSAKTEERLQLQDYITQPAVNVAIAEGVFDPYDSSSEGGQIARAAVTQVAAYDYFFNGSSSDDKTVEEVAAGPKSAPRSTRSAKPTVEPEVPEEPVVDETSSSSDDSSDEPVDEVVEPVVDPVDPTEDPVEDPE